MRIWPDLFLLEKAHTYVHLQCLSNKACVDCRTTVTNLGIAYSIMHVYVYMSIDRMVYSLRNKIMGCVPIKSLLKFDQVYNQYY